MTTDVDGISLSFHLVESPRTGRYPRPFSWKTISFLRFLGRRSKSSILNLWRKTLRLLHFRPRFTSSSKIEKSSVIGLIVYSLLLGLFWKRVKRRADWFNMFIFCRRCGSRRSTFSQHSRWAKQRYSCLQKRREQWSCLKKPFLIPSQHGQMRRNEFA